MALSGDIDVGYAAILKYCNAFNWLFRHIRVAILKKSTVLIRFGQKRCLCHDFLNACCGVCDKTRS